MIKWYISYFISMHAVGNKRHLFRKAQEHFLHTQRSEARVVLLRVQSLGNRPRNATQVYQPSHLHHCQSKSFGLVSKGPATAW
jgi:hypothetical protein